MDPNQPYMSNPIPSPAPMAGPAPTPAPAPAQIYDNPTPPPTRKKPALPTIVFAIISVVCLGFAVFFFCQYINSGNQITSLTSTLNAKDQSIATYEARITELETQLKEYEEKAAAKEDSDIDKTTETDTAE